MNADPSLSRPGHKPAHVLLVDDDPDVLRVLGSALQLFNYKVDTAGDGDVAWEALASCPYDLVITDHMMPRLTGLELLRKVRGVRRDLPCILISGDLPSVEADLAALLWPGRAVEKPIRLEKLVALVNELLAAHPAGAPTPRPGNARLTVCPA